MSEKPIIFSTERVRAILDDRKTQTRRVFSKKFIDMMRNAIRLGEVGNFLDNGLNHGDEKYLLQFAKYQVGDKLWVRETFRAAIYSQAKSKRVLCETIYKADYDTDACLYKWKSPIFMPKKYARIWLEVTNVRVERLKDINLGDMKKEGLFFPQYKRGYEWQPYKKAWITLWDSINAKRGYSWESNPWVWVIEFERIK